MYQSFTEGYGGACSVYDPPRSPWCSDKFYLERQFPEMHTRMPSGLDRPYDHLPNGPYASANGTHIFAWRPGHWYTWMFEVGLSTIGPNASDTSFLFSGGGNQGGEGSDTAGEWFIENVLEELDAPNEFFFSAEERKLYLYYNGTAALPPSDVVAPALAQLIAFRGSALAPVRNVSLVDLTFRDTRPTYMDPRGNPSGGDWALERSGAIFLEGTRDC